MKKSTDVDLNFPEQQLSPEEKYPVGSEVNFPRSDGRVTVAKIKLFEPKKQRFLVRWKEGGEQWRKWVTTEELNALNPEVKTERGTIRHTLENIEETFKLRLAERIRAGVVIIDGKEASDLADSMKSFEAPWGEIVAATDKGVNYKEWNEDRVGIDPKKGLVVVADGIGGYEDGDRAAQTLVESILLNPDQIPEGVEEAKKRMEEAEIYDGGACFIAVKVREEAGKKKLDVYQAGDVRIVVYDRDGNIKFQSKDESDVQDMLDRGVLTEDKSLYCNRRHIITNSIQFDSGTVKIYDSIPLEPGYTIGVMSDGISDNVTSKEMVNEIKGKTINEAVQRISELTNQRMLHVEEIIKKSRDRDKTGKFSDGYRSAPKRDNRAFALMNIAA